MSLVTVFFSLFSSPALAVQRYIYVCHAPVAKQWCTVSRSWMFVTMILLGAATTMMPRLLDRNYSVTTSGDPPTLSPTTGRVVCGYISVSLRAQMMPSDWLKNVAADNSSNCR